MTSWTLRSCCLLLSLLQLCHIAVDCHPPVPADIDCPMPERSPDDNDSNAEYAVSQMYFPDSSDCSIFYQCSYGIPYKLHCPLGTLFDSSLNRCNWPDAVDCGGGNKESRNVEESVEGSGGEPSEKPVEENVEGSGAQLLEPADKPVNELVESLEKPMESMKPMKPVEEPLELVEPMELVEPVEPASESVKPLKSANTEEDDICDNVPSDINKQFPYPNDCKKYIRCIQQVPVTKVCPWLKHFNPIKELCQFPWRAGCQANY